jgi:hypothetical protein
MQGSGSRSGYVQNNGGSGSGRPKNRRIPKSNTYKNFTGAQNHLGDMKIRSKLKFEVVTAKVVEESGKKHVVRTPKDNFFIKNLAFFFQFFVHSISKCRL